MMNPQKSGQTFQRGVGWVEQMYPSCTTLYIYIYIYIHSICIHIHMYHLYLSLYIYIYTHLNWKANVSQTVCKAFGLWSNVQGCASPLQGPSKSYSQVCPSYVVDDTTAVPPSGFDKRNLNIYGLVLGIGDSGHNTDNNDTDDTDENNYESWYYYYYYVYHYYCYYCYYVIDSCCYYVLLPQIQYDCFGAIDAKARVGSSSHVSHVLVSSMPGFAIEGFGRGILWYIKCTNTN